MTALNVIGIILYLGFASQCWIEPELADVPGASGGDALVWGLSALPIMAAFFLINLSWLIVECAAYLMRKNWRLSLVALAIPVVVAPVAWAIAIHVDYSHHGI